MPKTRRNGPAPAPVLRRRIHAVLKRTFGLTCPQQEEAGFSRGGHFDNCRRIAAHQAEVAGRAAVEALEALPDRHAGNGGGGCGGGHGGTRPPVDAPRDFRPDDIVKVKRYGKGRVVSADALSVTGEFPTGDRRSFQPDYVQRAGPETRRGAAGAIIGSATATAAVPQSSAAP